MAAYYKEITQDDFKNNEYLLNVLNYNSLSFQSVGEIVFSIKGNINDKENYTDLCAVRLNDFGSTIEINDNNIYVIDISGVDFIKIILSEGNSDAKINIKAV